MPFRSPTLVALAVCVQQNANADATARTASHFLHWLYVVAAVLAVILLLVIALAVHAWRKNKDSDR